MNKIYRIDLYVPDTHLEIVKNAMFDAGAGKIGSYDSCCWEVEGKGQFRALSGSNPFIGKMGEIENVKEFKIEVVCRIELVEKVVKAIMESHPYETPAYQIIEAFVL